MHENYDFPLDKSNDIALINLITPAILGVGIGLVCMPDTSHALPFDNVYGKCWVTGWGTLSSGGSQPNTLMEAQVPLVSKQRCQSAYPGDIDDTMLCAGLDSGGVDTCQGDSGGPLVCEFNGTWYLEGVTSWGFRCAYAGKYGVYAYVRRLKAWVSRHIYQVVAPTVFPQNQSASALGKFYFIITVFAGAKQLRAKIHLIIRRHFSFKSKAPVSQLVLSVRKIHFGLDFGFYFFLNIWNSFDVKNAFLFCGSEYCIVLFNFVVGCYFDNGICSGWTQSSSDDFDWTLAGSTPSSSTGPTSGQGGSGQIQFV